MGFGSLLLKTLIAEAKRLPEIQCIGLSSLPGSIKFYKRRVGCVHKSRRQNQLSFRFFKSNTVFKSNLEPQVVGFVYKGTEIRYLCRTLPDLKR